MAGSSAGVAPKPQPPSAQSSKAVSQAASKGTAVTKTPPTPKAEEHLCFTNDEIEWITKHNLAVPTNTQIREAKFPMQHYTPALLLMVNPKLKGDLKFWEPAFRIFDEDFNAEHALTEEEDPDLDETQSWAYDNLFENRDTKKKTLGAELFMAIQKGPPPSYNPLTKRYHPVEGCPFGRDAEWVGDQLWIKIRQLRFNNARNLIFNGGQTPITLQYYTPLLLVDANLKVSSVINIGWLAVLSLLLGREDASRLLEFLGFKLNEDLQGKMTAGQAILQAFGKLKRSQYSSLPQFSPEMAEAKQVHPIPIQQDLPNQDPEMLDIPDDAADADGQGQGHKKSAAKKEETPPEDSESEHSDSEHGDSDNNSGKKKSDNSDSGHSSSDHSDSGNEEGDDGEEEEEDEVDQDDNNDQGQEDSDRKPECLTLRSDEFELPYPLKPILDKDKVKADAAPQFPVSIPYTFKEKMDDDTRDELIPAFEALASLVKKTRSNTINGVKVKDRAKYIGNRYPTGWFDDTLYVIRRIDQVYTQLVSGRGRHCKHLRKALWGTEKKKDKDGDCFRETFLNVVDRAHKIAQAQHWAARRQQYIESGDPIPEKYRVPSDDLPSETPKAKGESVKGQQKPEPKSKPSSVEKSSSAKQKAATLLPVTPTQVQAHPAAQGQAQGQIRNPNTASRPLPHSSLPRPPPQPSPIHMPGPFSEHRQAQGFRGRRSLPSPMLLNDGYNQPQNIQSPRVLQNHGHPLSSLDLGHAQDQRYMQLQRPYEQYGPQTYYRAGPYGHSGQHGGSYNQPSNFPLLDSNAMALDAPPQGHAFDPGSQINWNQTDDFMSMSGQIFGDGQGQSPQIFDEEQNLDIFGGGQGHDSGNTAGFLDQVATGFETVSETAPLGLDDSGFQPEEPIISTPNRSKNEPSGIRNLTKRKRRSDTRTPADRGQDTKRPRLDDRAQAENTSKFIKEYREEMAKSDTKVKATWSNTVHEGLGVAQGDFTSTTTLKFVKSTAMTGEQRKILAQIQQSCNEYDNLEDVKEYLQSLVTSAFRMPNPGAQVTFKLNRSRWVVTGSIGAYKDRELSIAHALTIVFQGHGQEAMEEAARAFALFEIWAPDCSGEKESGSLKTYPINHYSLKGGQIATAMWPETVKDKASHVRRMFPFDQELQKQTDAEVSKRWAQAHMDLVARVMNKGRMPGEYPAVTTRHVDDKQDLDKVDRQLTGEFFLDTIVPALESAWPGASLDTEALWEAVMTDGQSRKNPWSNKTEQSSSLGALPRAKQVKKVKVEEEDEDEGKKKTPSRGKKKAKTDKTETTETTEKPEKSVKKSVKSTKPTKSKTDGKKTIAKTPTTSKVKVKEKETPQSSFMDRLRKNAPLKSVAELEQILGNPKFPEDCREIVEDIINTKKAEAQDGLDDLANELGI